MRQLLQVRVAFILLPVLILTSLIYRYVKDNQANAIAAALAAGCRCGVRRVFEMLQDSFPVGLEPGDIYLWDFTPEYWAKASYNFKLDN